jgi:hypothetical protein
MKTARFAKVVEASGRPAVHLLLVAPAKDAAFQRALKENRVMTVHRPNVGATADFGAIGYEKGPGQILIFPKSLKRFSERRIVGIDFALTAEPPLHESAIHLAAGKEPAVEKSRRRKKTAADQSHSTVKTAATPSREISFPSPAKRLTPTIAADSREVRELKATIRKAMRSLEADKPVAAYNTLKKVVGD